MGDKVNTLFAKAVDVNSNANRMWPRNTSIQILVQTLLSWAVLGIYITN